MTRVNSKDKNNCFLISILFSLKLNKMTINIYFLCSSVALLVGKGASGKGINQKLFINKYTAVSIFYIFRTSDNKWPQSIPGTISPPSFPAIQQLAFLWRIHSELQMDSNCSPLHLLETEGCVLCRCRFQLVIRRRQVRDRFTVHSQ